MDRREEILLDALVKNAKESERWTQYKDEHKTVVENLDNFTKKLEVDIMVPIGTKALIPGTLCHTNEVLISHGTIFSKCTAYQAQEICKHRITIADDQLKKLQTEREFFSNKLEGPQLNFALGDRDQIEIIEEYDEEKEKIWQAQHSKNVQEAAIQKKLQREQQNDEPTYEELMKKLDELEAMDKLEQELEDCGIYDDMTLDKLMDLDKQHKEKKRIAHNNVNSTNETVISNIKESTVSCEKPINVIPAIKKSTIIDELEQKSHQSSSDLDSDDIPSSSSSSSSSTSEIPKEIIEMEEAVQHLSPTKQIKFYLKEIKKLDNDIEKIKIISPIQLEEKLHKIEIRDYIIDLISILEDQIDDDNDDVKIDLNSLSKFNEKKNDEVTALIMKPNHTKRIKFAEQNEIKYIDDSVSVENMFHPEKPDTIQRDVIKLDPELESLGPQQKSDENIKTDPKKSVIEKVEEHLKFIKETQPPQTEQDYDLVSKILSTTEQSESRTLEIHFQHTDNVPPKLTTTPKKQKTNSVIGSPADIYKKFGNNKNIDKVPSTNLNVEDLSASAVKKQPVTILKNKESVKLETHLPQKLSTLDEQTETNTYYDYETIVGEVKENIITEPDPLPETNFVDTHLPKKRISKFKKSRTLENN